MITERMLAYVQCLMMAAAVRDMETPLYQRLLMIDGYLIRRMCRDD